MRFLAKEYLNHCSEIDWFYQFLIRNNILTGRFAQNIKRLRANTTEDIIQEYF